MNLLGHAVAFASKVHQDHLDKAHRPYILHPIRVMMRLRDSGHENDIVCAGVLHDVLEMDPSINLNDLVQKFGWSIASIVDVVSRKSGETYNNYIKRLSVNRKARAVKILDIADNLDRLHELPAHERNRLRQRYFNALEIISAAKEE